MLIFSVLSNLCFYSCEILERFYLFRLLTAIQMKQSESFRGENLFLVELLDIFNL